MRIATYQHQGQRHVGLVDPDGRTVTPLAMSAADAARGALPLVERAARGEALPATAGAALPLDAVTLEAPIPLPRRNVWCVGRNYHAHAKELRETVFKNSNADPQAWPIVFTKVPEC
ncbi:MAG: Rv2993c-like domain-containing protein, partial [Rubrivivax sp.]